MNSAVMANFQESLKVLVYGMGGIFVVLFAIYLLIKLLIFAFPEQKTK
jgi:Na+-transporting methylmalonyl-CoA/oxaloacetate decarboxylase gamma subunit